MEKHYNPIYIRIIIVLLLLIFIVTSCTNSVRNSDRLNEHKNGKINSEYIVTVKKYCDEFTLRKFFYEYGILEIYPIEVNVYLLKFANDPGLKELTREAKKTNAIQDIRLNNRKKITISDY